MNPVFEWLNVGSRVKGAAWTMDEKQNTMHTNSADVISMILLIVLLMLISWLHWQPLRGQSSVN
jgi:hypothetical protein